MRLLTTTSALALCALVGAAASAQEAANIASTELLDGFSLLLTTPAGQAVLDDNLATAIATNNGATDDERAQALVDNTIAALVGSMTNGQLVTDALGSKLSEAFDATNALHQNYTATTFSPAFAELMTQVNMLVQSDSSFAKNFYANGSVHGDPAEQATGISLPAGGSFNVYDQAYDPLPANANTVGNSRPIQVAPAALQSISGTDYFGNPVTSSTGIWPTLQSNASFPSGHTAFGFAATTLLAIMVPERFQELLTRGSEYGNSRVVLGAHYPLDVIGARVMTLKAVADMLNNSDQYTNRSFTSIFGQPLTSTDDFAALMAEATSDLRTMLADGCGDTIAGCIATSDTDRFSDKDANAADYAERLTYGFAPVGDATLDPVVPEGAEVLLSTRFSYLDADQRREVLATTELPSGQPLDDGSGWARLDLYTAANGYGAFRDDVTVTMDAGDGGFAASDVWSNDIAGPGGLTKRGTGKLELAGENSYEGGTVVGEGELAVTGSVTGPVEVAAPATLSGSGAILGDVTVAGLLEPGMSPGRLTVDGSLIMVAGSTLGFEFAGSTWDAFDSLIVTGDLTLQDTVLDITLLDGFRFALGQYFEIVDLGGTLTGLFAGLAEGARIAGYGADLFITYAGGDGNDIALYTAPVPLPATVALLATGLGGLALMRRRR